MHATGKIKAARLTTSPRLQRTLNALRRAGAEGLTTREIQAATGNCNPHTDTAEIVDERNAVNGVRYEITCTFEGMTDDGARVHRYRLTRDAGVHEPVPRAPLVLVADDGPDEAPAMSRAECVRRMREAVR